MGVDVLVVPGTHLTHESVYPVPALIAEDIGAGDGDVRAVVVLDRSAACPENQERSVHRQIGILGQVDVPTMTRAVAHHGILAQRNLGPVLGMDCPPFLITPVARVDGTFADEPAPIHGHRTPGLGGMVAEKFTPFQLQVRSRAENGPTLFLVTPHDLQIFDLHATVLDNESAVGIRGAATAIDGHRPQRIIGLDDDVVVDQHVAISRSGIDPGKRLTMSPSSAAATAAAMLG